MKVIPVIILGIILLSCGIDEYYFLPQLPEENIRMEFSTYAEVNIPSISRYYYAQYYAIYYRIYISDYNTSGSINTDTEMRNVSSTLYSDYSALYQYTDPTNEAVTTPSNLFSNRNYYELDFDGYDITRVLSKDGGTIYLRFWQNLGEIPTVSVNDSEERIYLKRSNRLISPVPEDKYFLNSSELNDFDSAISGTNQFTDINADVHGGNNSLSERIAYVNMYIVAFGSANMQAIYGRPTHIGVFRLPERY